MRSVSLIRCSQKGSWRACTPPRVICIVQPSEVLLQEWHVSSCDIFVQTLCALCVSPLSFQAPVPCSTWAFPPLLLHRAHQVHANLALACLLCQRADPLANTSSLYPSIWSERGVLRHNCNSLRFEGFVSRPPTSGPPSWRVVGVVRHSASFGPVFTFSRNATCGNQFSWRFPGYLYQVLCAEYKEKLTTRASTTILRNISVRLVEVFFA